MNINFLKKSFVLAGALLTAGAMYFGAPAQPVMAQNDQVEAAAYAAAVEAEEVEAAAVPVYDEGVYLWGGPQGNWAGIPFVPSTSFTVTQTGRLTVTVNGLNGPTEKKPTQRWVELSVNGVVQRIDATMALTPTVDPPGLQWQDVLEVQDGDVVRITSTSLECKEALGGVCGDSVKVYFDFTPAPTPEEPYCRWSRTIVEEHTDGVLMRSIIAGGPNALGWRLIEGSNYTQPAASGPGGEAEFTQLFSWATNFVVQFELEPGQWFSEPACQFRTPEQPAPRCQAPESSFGLSFNPHELKVNETFELLVSTDVPNTSVSYTLTVPAGITFPRLTGCGEGNGCVFSDINQPFPSVVHIPGQALAEGTFQIRADFSYLDGSEECRATRRATLITAPPTNLDPGDEPPPPPCAAGANDDCQGPLPPSRYFLPLVVR